MSRPQGWFPPHDGKEPEFFKKFPVRLLKPIEMEEEPGLDTRPAGTEAYVEWIPNRMWYIIIDGLITTGDGATEGVDFEFIK